MTRSALTAYSVPTSKYSSRQGYSPRRFILHHTAGGGNQGNINLLAGRPDYEVSCNYLSLTTGEIVSIVPEEYRAWTTGWEADRDSITQETVNTGGAPDWPVSAQQIENVAQLVADCSRRYGWGRIGYGVNFFVHQNFNATACPGPTLMGAITSIVNRANDLLGETGWQPAPSGGNGYPSGTYNGYSISEIQRRLGAAEFPVDVDDVYGPDTTAKVVAFQRSRGLDADGIVGSDTWGALNGASPAGTAALDVDGLWGSLTTKALQRALGVTADGIIGPDTSRALQRKVGVTVDGIIGPDTRRGLQRHLGVTVDGIWGWDTTRTLQARLNAGSF